MKRFVLLYTLLLSLFSCSNNNRMSELSSIDNMLDSLDYASASKALVKIGTEKLSGEQKAYYQLLKTRYAFGKNNFIDDSLSLNSCIDYYKAKNMKDELARAYFYKGEMYRLAGDMAKALFYEKESELIFKNCDLNKRRNLDIYQQLCEALAYINIIFDEDKLSLHYCKLSLQSAQNLATRDIRYLRWAWHRHVAALWEWKTVWGITDCYAFLFCHIHTTAAKDMPTLSLPTIS